MQCSSRELDSRETPTYAVSFQGTDGSEVSTSDVALISPDNERIPSVIVQPTIVASFAEDKIELRTQIVPSTTPGTPATSYYVLNVTGDTQQWTEGVFQTTFQWLQRRRKGSFAFFAPIFMGLMAIGVGCIVMGFLVASHGKPPVLHLTNHLGLSLVITGIASSIAGVAFTARTPFFSVLVRPATNYLTLTNIALVATTIGALFSIYSVIMKALGH